MTPPSAHGRSAGRPTAAARWSRPTRPFRLSPTASSTVPRRSAARSRRSRRRSPPFAMRWRSRPNTTPSPRTSCTRLRSSSSSTRGCSARSRATDAGRASRAPAYSREHGKEHVDVGTPRRAGEDDNDLEEFFDLSVDLLCIVGFDGYFRRVNASLERTLGYPKAELFSRTVFDITHPDDVQPSREALAQLGEGHDVVGFESRVVCADGSMRWLEWNTRTRPERGVVYGVARDTTERRRADAELRDAQAQLEASRDELRMLADEQAALRRVATLVARETPPEAVFAAVGREVGEVLGVEATHLGRYDSDGTVVSVAQWGSYASVPIGARFPLGGDSVSARVLRTGRPARMDSYEDAPGVIAATIRHIGIRFSIGVPISVEGRPWGVMIATSKGSNPFPAETESRLQDFTELVATAIANTEARSEVDRLAEEQAGLRHVATLVARSVPPAEVFEAVAREAGQLLGVDAMHMGRYDDGAAISVAGWSRAGDHLPVGTRVELD